MRNKRLCLLADHPGIDRATDDDAIKLREGGDAALLQVMAGRAINAAGDAAGDNRETGNEASGNGAIGDGASDKRTSGIETNGNRETENEAPDAGER